MSEFLCCTGIYTHEGTTITGVKRNGTGYFHVTLKGTLNVNMQCSGGTFIDGENEYTKVYVRDYIETYHKKYKANVELESEVVQFFEGYKANYADGYLFTSELGTCIWQADPITCTDLFSILYRGPAIRISANEMPMMLYINEPKVGGQLFVELMATKIICHHYIVHETGVDGVLIQVSGDVALPSKEIDPVNMVLTRFTQVKSGFVFRKLQVDIFQHYSSIVYSNCYDRNQLFKMQIQQMMAHPDDMTLHVLIQEEGVIAKKLGDVVYLMQCKPVHVELRVPKYCTNELPVVYNGSEYYLLSVSSILTKRANKVQCTALTPVIHKAGGVWYRNDGRTLIREKAPKKLRTTKNSVRKLQFKDFHVAGFDQNGLYSAKDLKKTQLLFYTSHDIKLVNEDVGQGILHGDNTYSYNLAPVSSPTGFLHWAQNTLKELLGPFAFITEGLGYVIMVLLILCVLATFKKIKALLLRALADD